MSNHCLSNGTKIAAIDVGSNSVKVLAAEETAAGFVSVWQDLRTTRLQDGMMEDGCIAPEALLRTEEAICAFAEEARKRGATRIEAFGTSALRDARNTAELVQRVRVRAGIRLRVVSGQEEAQAAFRAAAPIREAFVVNPGGGSTEMIVGREGTPCACVSAHIGALSLRKQAQDHAPAELVETGVSLLSNAFHELKQPVPAHCIASGGTAVAAARILKASQGEDYSSTEGFLLQEHALAALLHTLWKLDMPQRLALPGMYADRADILPYGIALLLGVMHLSHRSTFSVTEKSNLWGFLSLV